ncbi:MAG: diadenylate cyclase CdaA [Bacillota bacterium]
MSIWDNIIIYLGFDSPISILRVSIDVAIVSFAIYKLLVLIRDTRAWQLMKGVIFVLLAWKISEFFGLNSIQYILENTIQYIAIAMIVLFQPELRRGLEQLGRSKFIGILPSNESQEVALSNMVGAIVAAVENLSGSKTGAIIVLEGATKLGDVMDESVEIDSKISTSILINIFKPDTPLHDGAVIIRETRIQAAACYLPLARSTMIPKELGTRHRAAIGISEVSDALAIVVSEETGQISTANDGNLQRGLTPDLLRVKLRKHLMIDKPVEKTNPLKKFWKRGAK